ncbi:MAG: tetratricopeptide repeat protein [Candidatus Omnitrophota bacterium]|jgi:tetratricopeptide (TPR) repeat protein|nr:MAG: tetratricopeptide repeat protein [Candidatus Omnitrophota bacterium]
MCKQTLYPICISFLFIFVSVPCISVSAKETVTPETVFPFSLEIAKKAQQQFPKNADSHFLVGNVYYRAQQYEDAIAAFKKGLEIKPNQIDIVQLIAFIYSRQSRFEEAAEWYRMTLALNPRAPQASERLGLALVQCNQMEEARQAFEDAVRTDPQDASAHYHLAERYSDEGRLGEAIKEAELTIQHDNRFPEPYYLLSNIYRKQGNPDQSKEMLERFRLKKEAEEKWIEQNEKPDSGEKSAARMAAQTLIEAGALYYQQKRDKEAESCFLRALSLDAKNEPARFNLAHLYQEKGRNDKAAALFGELIVINANDYRYHLGMGMILAAQKEWLEAERCLDKALALQPDAVEAQRTLARVLLLAHRDPIKALQLMRQAVEIEKNAENYNYLSQAYYMNGQLEESLEAMGKALELAPNNPTYRQRFEKLRAAVMR